ncbi:MAG: hypothetical protein SYC29_16505 [Planctomycetota bacterium]|nr:hypothetical protein [Planctomycetota bacterium]
MGQVALGFRSLLIKLAVFVIMAALLAWALGGTLWPRAEIVQFEPVSFDGREWSWRLSVGGRENGQVRWRLMVRDAGGPARPWDERTWVEVAGPVATDDMLCYAGRASFNPAEPWRLATITAQATSSTFTMMPDRLAVERQLARLNAGLPLEDVDEVRRLRPIILDPPAGKAETGD